MKFLGPQFSTMLTKKNIIPVPATVKYPQATVIVGSLHQTLRRIISIRLQENPHTLFEDVATLVQRKCAVDQFSTRATSRSQHRFSQESWHLEETCHILMISFNKNRS